MSLNLLTIQKLKSQDEGQGLVEYALILVLIAIVAIAALIFIGGSLSTTLSKSALRSDLRSTPYSDRTINHRSHERSSPLGPDRSFVRSIVVNLAEDGQLHQSARNSSAFLPNRS